MKKIKNYHSALHIIRIILWNLVLFLYVHTCVCWVAKQNIHHHGSVQKKSESHYFKSLFFLSMSLLFSVSYLPAFSQPLLGIQEFPCLGIQEWPTFFPVTSHSRFMSCLLSSGLFRKTERVLLDFYFYEIETTVFECVLTKRVNWTWMQNKDKIIFWLLPLLGGEQGMFSEIQDHHGMWQRRLCQVSWNNISEDF